MNLAEAPVVTNIKAVASSTPTDRLTFEVRGTNITLPASDVARLVIEHLMRATHPTTQDAAELLAEWRIAFAEWQRSAAPATLPASAAESVSADITPRIGALWPAEGGIYAGVVRGDEGKPDYHLIVAEAQPDAALPWKDAMEWAQGGGYTLPDRKEQAVLYGNVPELFEKAWYWSRETHAGHPESAWYQYFDYGCQDYNHKNVKLRARAVRRVPIQ